MRLLLAVIAGLLGLAASLTASASSVTVDCTGGGDFEDIAEAIWYTNVDTILVAPCTYHVTEDWWPVPLDGGSPTIIGVGGASATIIEGDGTRDAFFVFSGDYNAHISIHGLTFRGVRRPVWNLGGGGLFLFTDNIIEDCAHGLDANGAWGSSLVARNLIKNCGGTGISIYHNNGVIEQNEICYNAGGIGGVCCEQPTIRQNHVHHNTGCGIGTGFHANITDNLIEHNGGPGISTWSVSGNDVIDGNVIRFNGAGVVLEGFSFFQFHHNDVYGNDSYNVECDEHTGGLELNATMNWWGTTDPGEIAAGIHDCHDDPAVSCCVIYEPWCTQPGCEASSVENVTWGRLKSLYRAWP